MSISESHISQLFLSVLHHDHSSTVAQENTLTPWDDASEEALHSLLLINMLCTFVGTPSEILAASLSLILKNLKWPNNPETDHRGATRGKELADFVIKYIGMTSQTIDDTEISGHETESSHVQHIEACISVSQLPSLSCLSSHFREFKRAFNHCSGCC